MLLDGMILKSKPLRGVIFDMDGVLCDSEPFIAKAACRMFAETYRLSVSHRDFLPFVGTGENRFIGGVAEKYGVTINLARDKARVYAIYLEIIRGRLQPLPGARDFIADCRQRGFRLAVATSADRIKLDGNLAEIGIPPQTFDTIITGDRIQRKKPDPEIFLKAAAQLDFVPQECLVIEDAENGVRAAKSAGSRCLALTTTYDAAQLQAAGADWTAPDLAHVPPVVFNPDASSN